MVDSNTALASGQVDKLPESVRSDAISAPEAAENVSFLRSQADSWLAVLFNVFSSVGKETQGNVGEVISAWITIASEQVSACVLFLFPCAHVFHYIIRRLHKHTSDL